MTERHAPEGRPDEGPSSSGPRLLGVGSASLLVVASMVGTGVFTTTGLLVRDLASAPAVLVAWLVGGVAALAGALSYGELAAALPRNGGEYALLARIYGPSFGPPLGFVAGLVSFVVGFAAPAAASTIAFGDYLRGAWPGLSVDASRVVGLGLLVGVGVLHALTTRHGARFQNVTTALKVALLVAFVAFGLPRGELSRLEGPPILDALLRPSFAVGLVFVAYAYTGWNAAAYVAGETHTPGRNLPRALALGTAIVTVLYLGLNATFLMGAPAEALAGKVEVGEIAARGIFGPRAAQLVSALVAWGLVSNVGAFVMAGPRVLEVMGQDHPRLAALSRRRAGGGPTIATGLLVAIAVAMALTTSFDALLIYVGVLLSLFSATTVVGVFVLRWREPQLPRPYRVFAYPFTPLVFLALSGWMIVFAIIDRPITAAWAGGTLVLGLVLHRLVGARVR